MEVYNKDQLLSFVQNNWELIQNYFDERFRKVSPPVYCSVDIRENSKKLAPVDHNFFPAGFNNLVDDDLQKVAKGFRDHFPHIRTVALIPESNTKNSFYLDNIAVLKKSLELADFRVELVTSDETLFTEGEQLSLTSYSGETLTLKKIWQREAHLWQRWSGEETLFECDAILLNHDQSRPLAIDWEQIAVPTFPSPKVGWNRRTKSGHFFFYHQVVQEFADYFQIDPDLLEAKFDVCDDIDFQTKQGLSLLEQTVDKFLLGLPSGSKVFVKANQGTYGMGISVVDSGKEIAEMNRKTRNKMDIGKNNLKFRSVILQESVETTLSYNGMPAEVTVYLVGGRAVGALLRANSLRGSQDNLNAKGMILEKLPIDHIELGAPLVRKERLYQLVAQLSAYAGALELVSCE